MTRNWKIVKWRGLYFNVPKWFAVADMITGERLIEGYSG